ncbi:MFS transporter [Microbacter sp. ANSKLAB05]|nr:MFS transporter [Microbacter sp. ANSKLAB05]
MARYVYGLTLPDIRRDLGLPELVLGLVASASFVGYLAGLLLAGPLSAQRGPRAPTTVGGVCGALGAAIVVTAQSPWLLAVGAVLAGSAGGWVWAPYSDIVTRTVTARHQPRALAMITTGTGVGLIALGGLAVLAVQGSWRLVLAIARTVGGRLARRRDRLGEGHRRASPARRRREAHGAAATGCRPTVGMGVRQYQDVGRDGHGRRVRRLAPVGRGAGRLPLGRGDRGGGRTGRLGARGTRP